MTRQISGMELEGSTVLILGGAGLVGEAVARALLAQGPRRVVIAGLTREEAEESVQELRAEFPDRAAAIDPYWGDLFVPAAMKDRPRGEILEDPEAREALVDDLYGELTDEVFRRSALGQLLLEVRPEIVVDSINTAGALAYQNFFNSSFALRESARQGGASLGEVEKHLATSYLPQLIRHTQIALKGMREVGTEVYLKIGTVGTGGMGMNIPFTHSEERPSRMLMAKSSLAGAHTLLLYLMARTPGGPEVKEIKPTAAISWKALGYGPIQFRHRTLERCDATAPLPLDQAFLPESSWATSAPGRSWRGCTSTPARTASSPWVSSRPSRPWASWSSSPRRRSPPTPSRRSWATPRAGRGGLPGQRHHGSHLPGRGAPERRPGPPGGDGEGGGGGVGGLRDAGPSPPHQAPLRGGHPEAPLRHLRRGPGPGPGRDGGAGPGPHQGRRGLPAAHRVGGIPILLKEGDAVLRGPVVKILPPEGRPLEDKVVDSGWVDLRPKNWERWKERVRAVVREIRDQPGLEKGSRTDFDYGDTQSVLRPGRLAAWVFRVEDEGDRMKW
jgi:NAD(P)-dependent dehydrogenase (short-subunit alcohol dehydrogenase family)